MAMAKAIEDYRSLATLEVDGELVFEALDRKRRHEHISRRALAAMLGVTSPAYTYWSQGRGINADALVRACTWLDRDPRDFVRRTADAAPREIPFRRTPAGQTRRVP